MTSSEYRDAINGLKTRLAGFELTIAGKCVSCFTNRMYPQRHSCPVQYKRGNPDKHYCRCCAPCYGRCTKK